MLHSANYSTAYEFTARPINRHSHMLALRAVRFIFLVLVFLGFQFFQKKLPEVQMST